MGRRSHRSTAAAATSAVEPALSLKDFAAVWAMEGRGGPTAAHAFAGYQEWRTLNPESDLTVSVNKYWKFLMEKERYDALPEDCKVVPASVQSFANKLQVGDSSIPLMIQAESPRGLIWTRLVLHRHQNGLWVVDAWTTNGDVRLFHALDFKHAWGFFLNTFNTLAMCKECDGHFFGAECVTCKIRNDISVEKECGICHDKGKDFYHLLCGHSYRKVCLKRWKGRTCPECRTPYRVNAGWVEMDDNDAYSENDEDWEDGEDGDEVAIPQ